MRTPPQALETERALLGAMLVDPDSVYDAIDLLEAEDFYHHKHRDIFRAIKTLFDRGERADLITVGDEIVKSGENYEVYLTELSSEARPSGNSKSHAMIIKEKKIKRDHIIIGKRLEQAGYDETVDPFEAQAEIEQSVYGIISNLSGRAVRRIGETIRETLARLQFVRDAPDAVTGVTTGFKDLDKKTKGWQDSNLILIAARPSMGKSRMALSCARAAADSGVPAAFFSLEMSWDEVNECLLAQEAKVNARNISSDEDWRRLERAASRLDDAQIYVDDTPGLSMSQISAKARQLRARYGVGLIIVDYLQLIKRVGDNKVDALGDITKQLKGLAKDLSVPVIALVQLNRGVEDRNPPKPILSDLRGSGEIEEDADVVCFIYRPEYYGIERYQMGDGIKVDTEGLAVIPIAKQRMGEAGTEVYLTFIKEFGLFANRGVVDSPF